MDKEIRKFKQKIKDEINKAAAFDATVDLPAHVVTIDSASYKSSSAMLDWNLLDQWSVEVDLQKIMDDNDISSADFTNGRIDSYSATLIYPDFVDFSEFTDQFKVTAALNPNFADEVQVAQTTAINPGAKTVEFEVNDVDITSFIKADIFYLRLWAQKTNELPASLVNIEFNGEVKIKVNPL